MNDADGQPLKTPQRPILHFFRIFTLTIVLPSITLGLMLAWWSVHNLVERQEQEAVHFASVAAESAGNYVKTIFTGSQLLSQLPLGKDHFPDFYRVAKRFSEKEGYNVGVADGDGNQYLSTRFPLGATVPRRGGMDSVRKAIATGEAQISALFRSKSTGNYVVTVDAPVSTTDGLRIITIAVDPTSIAKVMSRISLPEGWLMGLIVGADRKLTHLRPLCRLKTDPGVLLALPKFWAGNEQGDHHGNVGKNSTDAFARQGVAA